jgi:hypothetical protein
MSRVRTLLIVPALAVLAAGCANSSQFRETSQLLAGFAAAHAAADKDARARYNALNSDLARINENRRQRADLVAAQVSDQTRAWGLADNKKALALVADGARVTPDQLVAIAGPPAPPAPLDPPANEEDFGKAVKAAADLGKAPGLTQQAKSLIAMYGQAHDEISKLKADAAKATAEAAAKAPATAQKADNAIDHK